jgi:bifunctional enzyme CysN/CysC
MVTGASTADVAMVLLDARRGITEQSRRHVYLASLLRVPYLVLCVNKMDLVDYDQGVFDALRGELAPLLGQMAWRDVTCIPMSALHGNNVVTRSPRMPWYAGPPLLEHLEGVPPAGEDGVGLRFPVQLVIRPMAAGRADYRGYAGQVASGVVRPGDAVRALPSGMTTRVAAVDTLEGPIPEAGPPQSVTLRLADELALSRGDLLCGVDDAPTVGQEVEAVVCWLAATPLDPAGRYLLKHTTRTTPAEVTGVRHRIDVNTLQPDPAAATLGLNDIGRLVLRTATPLVYDAYARSRATGSFILIDAASNQTVAAGLLLGPGEVRA